MASTRALKVVLLIGSLSFAPAVGAQVGSAPGTKSGATRPSTPAVDAAAARPLPQGERPALDAKLERGLALQVTLDRAGFSPGEIDGAPGKNTERALRAYQEAKGLRLVALRETALEDLGPAVNPLADYAISADDVAGPFVETIPADMMEKAQLPALAYTSVLELLAERFHASPALLKRLNPSAAFTQGEIIVVPNVEPFLAPGLKSTRQQTDAAPAAGIERVNPPAAATASPQKRGDAARASGSDAGARSADTASKTPGPVTVVVTDRTKTLQVQDAAGATIFHAPVTVGSVNDPLPVGEWKVNGVTRNPTFNYNPDLFWDADPSHAKAKVPPGPNNPVGVVWIDLSKEHYGIHGTPEPSRIGYTQSHGCIRLTNWDAMRVTALVAPGTKVVLR